MNIREINKPVTSKTLNETLAKTFGTKINVDTFTLEQLQDARNKIRSKVFDIETNESFGGLPENKTYSKNKLFLDVLNAAISERGDIQDEPLEEAQSAAQKAAFQKMLDKKKGKKPADTDDADKKPGGEDKEVDEAAKPDFLDMDKDGDKKEPMKKAIKDKKKKKTDEGKSIIGNYFSSLLEGAEDHAELVMASKDMVDRLTGWMEDTAEMQTESMLELADAIRDEMGAQQSEAFTNAVKPALEQLYASMETTRIALTTGVGMLTGEGETPAADMGAEADMDMDAEAGAEGMEPTDDLDADMDDFAAAAPAVGGDAEAGRERRESKAYAKKAMLERSRRLGTILSGNKR
jgi:hypothetical protein